MPLDTYTNLKASITNHSFRDDITPTLVDDFIDMAEAEIFNRLKLRTMEASATPSTSTADRYLELPTGFLEMRRLKINLDDGDVDVKYLAPMSMVLDDITGLPRHFTINNQIEFDRVSDQAYTVEMMYYASPTALSSSNASNTILARFPQIYLYAALKRLFIWARNPEETQKYSLMLEDEIAKANSIDRAGRYGPAPSVQQKRATP